jgi:protocatechuate 3,4-dioxygenase beta subunit
LNVSTATPPEFNWVAGMCYTDETGYYKIQNVPVGEVYVQTHASQEGYNQYLMDEWYGGTNSTPDPDQAQNITVNGGQTTPSANFQLDIGGTISGAVFESNGIDSIENLHVYVVSDACNGNWYGGANTDAFGNYTITGIPPGTVNVSACPDCNNQDYVNEWYDGNGGTSDCNQAMDIQVIAEQDKSDINFQLDIGGTISGTVVDDKGNPVEDLRIEVWSGKCWNIYLGDARTDENGNYTTTSLPPGEVYVRYCSDCDNKNYIDLWWNNAQGSADCNMASSVIVLPDGQTDKVDFNLLTGPKLVEWTELTVSQGVLGGGFDILPGFNHLLKEATLTGPNGFAYNFDIENDIFDWLNECSYLVAWYHDFTDVFDYGEYTFTITFKDGAQEAYTYDLKQINLTAVDKDSMSYTINQDGSIDFSWTNPDPTQQYQARIYQNGERVYRSGLVLNMNSIHVSAQDLRCVIQEGNAVWEVRAYDNNQPFNAIEKSGQIPLNYMAPELENRIWWFDAVKIQGKGSDPINQLNLYFDTRPGSRDKINSAIVTGPEGFTPYGFDLINDWYSISTETRKNSGWSKQFYPPVSILDGLYTLTVEFEDGYVETWDFNLTADVLTPVDSSTMGHEFNENGSMRFFWDLPPGITGQEYQVRIRSKDGSQEFTKSSSGTDMTQVNISARDLRALPQGDTFRWFVRTYDGEYDTNTQSDNLYFAYDPFEIDFRGDVNGDGSITLSDALLAKKIMAGKSTDENIFLSADVNQDGKIGMAEILYIYQQISQP